MKDILVAIGRPAVLLDASKTSAPEPHVNVGANLLYQGWWNGPAAQRGSRSTALLKQVNAQTEREEESLVLTDTAPLTISAETEFLARSVDSAVVIIESGVTTRAQLLAAVHALQRLEVGTVGFVLNRVGLSKADAAFRRSVQDTETHLRSQAAFTSAPPMGRQSAHEGPAYRELAAGETTVYADAAHSLPESAQESVATHSLPELEEGAVAMHSWTEIPQDIGRQSFPGPKQEPVADRSSAEPGQDAAAEPSKPQVLAAPRVIHPTHTVAEWPGSPHAATPSAAPGIMRVAAEPWWLTDAAAMPDEARDPELRQGEFSHSVLATHEPDSPRPPERLRENNSEAPGSLANLSAAEEQEPELEQLRNENGSRLNGLRALFFSLGLQNLGKSKDSMPGDEASLPAESEQQSAILSRVPQPLSEPVQTPPVAAIPADIPVLTRNGAPALPAAPAWVVAAAPVEIEDRVASRPVAAVPVPETAPIARAASVPAASASAFAPTPAPRVTPVAAPIPAAAARIPSPVKLTASSPKQVIAKPEFLPPREFVPVQNSKGGPKSGVAAGDNSGDGDDEIQVLPSRRGQYKKWRRG